MFGSMFWYTSGDMDITFTLLSSLLRFGLHQPLGMILVSTPGKRYTAFTSLVLPSYVCHLFFGWQHTVFLSELVCGRSGSHSLWVLHCKQQHLLHYLKPCDLSSQPCHWNEMGPWTFLQTTDTLKSVISCLLYSFFLTLSSCQEVEGMTMKLRDKSYEKVSTHPWLAETFTVYIYSYKLHWLNTKKY